MRAPRTRFRVYYSQSSVPVLCLSKSVFFAIAINAWQECGDGVVTIDYWIWYSGLAKHPRKLTDFIPICLCRQLEYHSTLDVESTFNSIS